LDAHLETIGKQKSSETHLTQIYLEEAINTVFVCVLVAFSCKENNTVAVA